MEFLRTFATESFGHPGGEIVSAATGSLSLSEQAPKALVAANVSVKPAGSLSLSGQVPTAYIWQHAALPAGSLSLSGQVPTVKNNFASFEAEIINAQFNLPQAYSDVYSWVNSQFNVEAYTAYQIKLNGRFALSAYSAYTAQLDSQFKLAAYAGSYSLLNAAFALNVYQAKRGFVSSSFTLDANQVYYCFVANLNSGAHSTYSNFDFNSLSGEYGCKADGLYKLTGSTDNGTAIAAKLTSGKTDFNDSRVKRIPDVYLSAASNGDIKLTATTESGAASYTFDATNSLGTNKIPLGLGLKGRFWQFELENVSGASFTVDSIELNLKPLEYRRHG